MNKMTVFDSEQPINDLVAKELANYERQFKVGDIVRHFKGNTYKVIALGLHSESLGLMIVYQSMKDEMVWVRPYRMFVSKVEGGKEYRFEKVDNSLS